MKFKCDIKFEAIAYVYIHDIQLFYELKEFTGNTWLGPTCKVGLNVFKYAMCDKYLRDGLDDIWDCIIKNNPSKNEPDSIHVCYLPLRQ